MDSMKRNEGKRTVQVNVRMTPADLELLERAAEAQWHGAEMSLSGTVLSLAKMAAKEIVQSRG